MYIEYIYIILYIVAESSCLNKVEPPVSPKEMRYSISLIICVHGLI